MASYSGSGQTNVILSIPDIALTSLWRQRELCTRLPLAYHAATSDGARRWY